MPETPAGPGAPPPGSDPRCPPSPDPYSGPGTLPRAASFEDLANPNDLRLGDKLIAFRQFARLVADDSGHITETDQPLPHLPHTAWRTVHDKLNEIVSVRDFGATGDGVTDDTNAIQAAMDHAFVIQRIAGQIPLRGNGASYTTVTVLFPTGRYQITRTINVNGGVKLQGDGFAALRGVRGTGSVPLLRLGGQHNWIDGLVFVGGLHHILFFGTACNPANLQVGNWGGPTAAVSLFKITHCMFKYADRESIKFDQSLTSNAVNGHLVVENFDFEGSRFFSGTGDTVTFSNGQVLFDLNETGSTQNDFDVACWTSGGALTLENIRVSGRSDPNVPHSRAALIRGTGIIYCTNVRLGELSCITVRTQASEGLGVPTDAGSRPVIVLQSSFFAANQRNWLEIYDQFPSLIHVSGMYPDFFLSSEGIYVDSNSIPLETLLEVLNSHNFLFRMDLQDNLVQGQERIRYAGNPDFQVDPGLDLAPYLRQYTKHGPAHGTDRPLENLFLPGGVDVFSGPWERRVAPGTLETSTGYAITPLENQTGGYLDFASMTTADWGANVEEGEYVFSAYFKSNFGGVIHFLVTNVGSGTEHRVAVRPLAGPAAPGIRGEYQRHWFNFYHRLGSRQRFGFYLYRTPPKAILYVGLFAIHRGLSPAPYKQPGNKTEGDFIRETGYGSEPPTFGAYKVGDIIWNTNPQPGRFIGWVCVIAGSPAKWKGFGSIET